MHSTWFTVLKFGSTTWTILFDGLKLGPRILSWTSTTSFKKQLALVDTIYTEKKLPQMSLVINDVKAQLGYGSYQGYVNYGYAGYGYGYRNDLEQYFETDRPRRFRWLSRLFGK